MWLSAARAHGRVHAHTPTLSLLSHLVEFGIPLIQFLLKIFPLQFPRPMLNEWLHVLSDDLD